MPMQRAIRKLTTGLRHGAVRKFVEWRTARGKNGFIKQGGRDRERERERE